MSMFQGLLIRSFLLIAMAIAACLQDTTFPSNFIDDRENFSRSIMALRKSSDLSQPPNKTQKGPLVYSKELTEKIDALKEEGLRCSKKVDDDFLDYIHPELLFYYRAKLIKGEEIYFEGLKLNDEGKVSEGIIKQLEGNRLLSEWIVWWKKHKDYIVHKAYPD